ncbi:hypothetical protein V865_006273 [Kwoniella europaea PYCC6329]|uniref:Uncharacterized protein n=1 Tax=Kwoniella europaea PYCC6329 TaxID=1423913 RepID=A0AAX4KP36_9TREE
MSLSTEPSLTQDEAPIPSYHEVSQDSVPSYKLGRDDDIPTTVYFHPRPLDFNLQYNMEPRLPLSRICDTFIHSGTYKDWKESEISIQNYTDQSMRLLYSSLAGHYEDYKAYRRDRNDCEKSIENVTDGLRSRDFTGQPCRLTFVDGKTMKDLKSIQKKVNKERSRGCLIYSIDDSKDMSSGLMPLIRRLSSNFSMQDHEQGESTAQAQSQVSEESGKTSASIRFYINYSSDLSIVQKDRDDLQSLAASLGKLTFASDKKDMELMARSRGFSIHKVSKEVLDGLVSCESWTRSEE